MAGQSAAALRREPSCVARQLSGCQVVMQTLPAGRTARHQLERPLVGAVITGRCETMVGGRRLDSRGDHAWCEPAGDVRTNFVAAPGARVLSVLPDAADASGLFDAIRPALARPTQRAGADITLAARRAWLEFTAGDSVAALALMGHAVLLVSAFARQERTIHHSRRPAWLPRVIDHLRAHYREPLSLPDVARIAAVDPAHLCRVFRAHTGSTVADYVRRLRIAWAARRIADSDVPITEIALGAGFADQSHLTKLFRQHLGVTPAVYRSACR